MANPTTTIERYIGGGKMYFTPYENGSYGTEIEIGEVKEAMAKVVPAYVEAFSRDTGVDKKVDKVLKEINASISFKTQNVNKENMRMAMLGNLTTESFFIGDELPDGTTATAPIEIPVIKGGMASKIEGKIRIVATNVTGNYNPVLLVHLAAITTDGDFRNYFASEHAQLSFSGEMIEVNDEYFNEYLIPKA